MTQGSFGGRTGSARTAGRRPVQDDMDTRSGSARHLRDTSTSDFAVFRVIGVLLTRVIPLALLSGTVSARECRREIRENAKKI